MREYLTVTVLLAAVGAWSVCFLLVPAEAAFYTRSDCCCNRSHNFFFGRRSPYDRLLFANTTFLPARPYKSSVQVILPPRPAYPAPVITYMEALDTYSDGLGGCARIISGGVGNGHVVFNFTSSPNHPIFHKINVYGHY